MCSAQEWVLAWVYSFQGMEYWMAVVEEVGEPWNLRFRKVCWMEEEVGACFCSE